MSPTQLLRVLWARRLVILGVVTALLLPAIAASVMAPKIYLARASIVVDSKGTDPVTGNSLPALLLPGYMSTQVDIITSHNVALKVVDRLKLADSPEARAPFEPLGDDAAIRHALADSLAPNLAVRPARDSSIITIEYSDRDPRRAAEIANTYIEAYIQTSLELRVDPARRQAEWFDEQVGVLRQSLERAQLKHSEFRKANGIVGADARVDLESARLAEISSQLVEAQAKLYESRSRLDQMAESSGERELRELPDILGNPLLQSMKVELMRAEARQAEAAQKFGPQHPAYRSAASDVQVIRERLEGELRTASGAMAQAHELAHNRVDELQRALDSQKRRVLELKQQQDQLEVLNREVENAQRVYDQAQQRASQVRLESRLDQSNIAVLNPAVPPVKPLKSKMVQKVLLAGVVGSALGVLLALYLEMRDRRIRSREDFDQLLKLDMLLELPRADAGSAAGRGGMKLFDP